LATHLQQHLVECLASASERFAGPINDRRVAQSGLVPLPKTPEAVVVFDHKNRLSRGGSRYEYALRHAEPLTAREPSPAGVRDPAFRRVVTEAYDWRCAATGLRVLLPTGESMAHLRRHAD